MRSPKEEIVEEINGLLDDCLSARSEWILRQLSREDLLQILRDLSPSTKVPADEVCPTCHKSKVADWNECGACFLTRMRNKHNV